MTLTEELEIPCGEPVEVFTGDLMPIPCIETSGVEIFSCCFEPTFHEEGVCEYGFRNPRRAYSMVDRSA